MTPATAAQKSPVTEAACSDDVWECLPAWRWGGWDGYSTPVSASSEWDAVAFASRALDASVNFMAGLPLALAKIVWAVTLQIVELVANPVFIVKLYEVTFAGLNRTWLELFRFIGVPVGGDVSGSTLWVPLLLAGLFVAIWQTIKLKPWTVAKYEVNSWHTGITALLSTLIPLGMLFWLAASIGDESSPAHPVKLMAYPVEAVEAAVMPIMETAAGTVGRSLDESSEDGTDASACTLYTRKLKEGFDPAANDGDDESNLRGLPGGSFLNAESTTRSAVPKMVSRMWESAYLRQVGVAQFGSPAVADRSMCYLLEWQRDDTTAEAQARVMYAALTEQPPAVAQPATGTASPQPFELEEAIEVGMLGVGGGQLGMMRDSRRAAEVFRPDSSSAEQQRSLMILAAACGFRPATTTATTNPAAQEPDPGSAPRRERSCKSGGIGHHNPPGGFKNGEPARLNSAVDVWLHPEWRGLQRAHTMGNGNMLSANVCAAWMFPHIVEWPRVVYGRQSGAGTLAGPAGLRSEWVLDHSAITPDDISRWQDKMKGHSDSGIAGTPSLSQMSEVSEVVGAVGGRHAFAVFAAGALTLLAAIVYLKAIGGLSLGVLLAHIILAFIFFLLPLLLLAVAVPVAAAAKLRKMLIRLFLAGMIAYALFYSLLMATVLLNDLLVGWFETLMIGSRFDGWLTAVVVAAAPILAVWIQHLMLKGFGIKGMTSVSGAVHLTSGLASAGVDRPNARQYARKAYEHSGARAIHSTGELGYRSARTAHKKAKVGYRSSRQMYKALTGSPQEQKQ